MKNFSEKSLFVLGEFYVYGLIDPRTNKIFYIGKGKGNRIFAHENKSINCHDSDNLKLKTIAEIKGAGYEVKKIIINYNLTEAEAFAAEASLINAFNYIDNTNLTNIVAGHHSSEALTVEDFEKEYGAVDLEEKDIKHKIVVIKINRLYRRDMNADELYNTVRGIWRVSQKRVENCDYVFGVYNSLIVAVYKPTTWFICKDAPDKLPRNIDLTEKNEERCFFVDEEYENGSLNDEYKNFYLDKSISKLKLNQSAQNPITYLNPFTEMKK